MLHRLRVAVRRVRTKSSRPCPSSPHKGIKVGHQRPPLPGFLSAGRGIPADGTAHRGGGGGVTFISRKKKTSWERTCARQSRSSSRLPSWPAKQFCRRAPATGTTASDEPAAGCPQRLSAADGRRRSDGTAVFAGQPASAPRFTFRRRTTERQRRSLESNPLSRKGPRGSNILVTENNDRVKSAAAAAAAAKENRCRRDRF